MDRKIIKITGKDATSFLQRVTSNDINKEGLIYSLLLTPQGKVLDDFFLLREGDTWLLDCFAEAQKDLLLRLGKYSLGVEVSFEEALEIKVFLSEEARGYQDPRDPRLGFRFYAKEAEELTQPPEDLYYQLALPRLYIDIPSGEFFPFDVGFDPGLSYNKGCYIGQEIITRTKFLGEVRKGVIKLQTFTSNKEDLYHEGRKIGKIIALYSDNRGLALVRRDLIVSKMELTDLENKLLAKVI
jgi:folate-binding protein YgfZ